MNRISKTCFAAFVAVFAAAVSAYAASDEDLYILQNGGPSGPQRP